MKKQLLRFEYKVKFCLWKSYFDTGFAYFNYVKYFIYVFIGYDVFINKSFLWFWISGILIIVWSFGFGKLWYSTDMVRAAAEVSNRYDLFKEEMRKKFKLKNSK